MSRGSVDPSDERGTKSFPVEGTSGGLPREGVGQDDEGGRCLLELGQAPTAAGWYLPIEYGLDDENVERIGRHI